MQEYQIEIEDFTISYLDENSKKDQTILFIHGNSLDKYNFIEQFNNNELNNYRLVALDLIGHGDSSRSKEPKKEYNIPFYSELITLFIKKLKLTNVVLVGHSLGGHVSMELVGKYPDLIKGMFLFGSPPFGEPADLTSAFLPNPSARLLVQEELNQQELEELANSYGGETTNKYAVSTIRKADDLVRPNLGTCIGGQNYLNEIDILNSLKIPHAIFLGENDPYCDSSFFDSHQFKNQWHSEVQIIKSGTHNLFMDNSIALNSKLNQFIQDLN